MESALRIELKSTFYLITYDTVAAYIQSVHENFVLTLAYYFLKPSGTNKVGLSKIAFKPSLFRLSLFVRHSLQVLLPTQVFQLSSTDIYQA